MMRLTDIITASEVKERSARQGAANDLHPRDVTDGSSTTLMIGERGSPTGKFCANETGEREAWLSAAGGLRTGDFDDSGTSHFWSFHPGGAIFAFADGHVRMLNDSLDQTTFWRMGSRNGGELIPDF